MSRIDEFTQAHQSESVLDNQSPKISQ